jgi:hypothetical protein
VDISIFSGGVAIAAILIGGKGQRLGDLAAGTTVISLKERAKLDDTIFAEIDDNYEPLFCQAADLDDKTIATIKETLNIIRSGEVLYFNLSDDLLLSAKITEQKTLSETITDIVLSEMATLKDMVDEVNFINFKDERLQQKLNALIERR